MKTSEDLSQDLANVIRGLTYTYLLTMIYISVTVGSVNYRDLLIGTTIQLPLFNVAVNIRTFFWVAPTILLVLHGNIINYIYIMRQLDNSSIVYSRVPFLPLSRHAIGDRDYCTNDIFDFVAWFIYIALPLLVLLQVQFVFLPYQDCIITPLHIIIILVDLLLIFFLWQDNTMTYPREPLTSFLRSIIKICSRIILIMVAMVSFCLWLDQRPDGLTSLMSRLAPRLLDRFNYNWSSLVISDSVLMTREPPPGIVVQMRKEARENAIPSDDGETSAYLDLAIATPLDLHDRSLRHAKLQNVKLYGVNLEGADLRGSSLRYSNLAGANLYEADFAGADLWFTNFKLATTCVNRNVKAEKCHANFAGADLTQALLQGADFRGADFAAAVLDGAKLQAANLEQTNFEGADLQRTNVRGASLCGAQMQGTNFIDASIVAVQFRGPADNCHSLYAASIRGASFSDVTDARYADFVGLGDGKVRMTRLKYLQKLMNSDYIEPAAKARLKKAIIDSSIIFRESTFKTLPHEKTLYSWLDSTVPDNIRAIIRENQAGRFNLDTFRYEMYNNFSKNTYVDIFKYIYNFIYENFYENALAGELVALYCDEKDSASARGLIRRLWSSIRDVKPYKSREYAILFARQVARLQSESRQLSSKCWQPLLLSNETTFMLDIAKRKPSPPLIADYDPIRPGFPR